MCLSKSSSSSSAANLADDELVQVDIPPSIYFGGCSWGAAFYIGVHRAMVENWGKLRKQRAACSTAVLTFLFILSSLAFIGPDFPQRTLIAGTVIGMASYVTACSFKYATLVLSLQAILQELSLPSS